MCNTIKRFRDFIDFVLFIRKFGKTNYLDMSKEVMESFPEKTPMFRKILWLSSLIFIITAISFIALDIEIGGIFFLFVTLALLVYLMFSSKKYYNWLMPLFVLFFVGLLFKRNQWPGAGVIFVISTTLIALELYLFSYKVFSILKHNSFLKWLGFACSIILSITMLTFLFRLMHWPIPIPFSILNHMISISLIAITFVLIIRLPNLNFSSWLSLDRKVFYRMIIMPLIIVFFISILSNVYPQTFKKIFFKETKNPWSIHEIELKPLEGIE